MRLPTIEKDFWALVSGEARHEQTPDSFWIPPLATPRTWKHVFDLARKLAMRFWSNDIVSARLATKTLLAGLNGAKYTVEKTNGGTRLSVQSPAYVELYVEYEYKDGIDHLEIGWQGNFWDRN